MADLVDRLEQTIRRHVCLELPDGSDPSDDLDLSDLLIEYWAWRARFVGPAPRQVHVSRELAEGRLRSAHRHTLSRIEQKIRAGADLTPHLSKAVRTPVRWSAVERPPHESRDLLLADWGIHHLHLSTTLASKGFVERTGQVLFAMFRANDAYLLGVFGHPRETNWAAEEIFAVAVRNWPDVDLAHQAKSAIELSQRFSDPDRLRLRDGGVNCLMEVDGKVYAPATMGQTLTGAPMEAARGVMKLRWQLREWRDDPTARLESASRGPAITEWLPAVRTSQPGLPEYCGFLAGSTFVPVGRLS